MAAASPTGASAVSAAAGCCWVLLQVCDLMKSLYEGYAVEAAAAGKPWNINKKIIFLRLDSYCSRNAALSSVVNTAQQFDKLEKIEICGSKGNAKHDGLGFRV